MRLAPRSSGAKALVTTVLRTLILEDRREDAELVRHALLRGGIEGEVELAGTREQYLEALDRPFDIVLADYRLPGYDALAALADLRRRQPETPLIVVTASLGDEAAVACIKRGAADYLLKDRLARLPAAVLHAVNERRLATDKRRAEVELTAVEKRFRQLIENVTDYSILILDQNGCVTTWNAGAEGLLGYTSSEILAKHFSAFYSEDDKRRRLPEELLRQAAASGRAETEGWRLRKDGQKFWANVIITALRDEAGVSYGFGEVARDFTERKRAEEALWINQRIFQTSLDLIAVTDRKGTFTHVSPSSAIIVGYEPEEMVGRSAGEFIYPEDLENTRVQMRSARRAGTPQNFECRYAHRNGRAVTVAWTGVWSEPEQRHFFIGRDVTEAKRQAKALAQSQKMEAVGQLTGGLAHDLNNLLGIVIGNLDLIQEELPEEHAVQQFAKDAVDACLRGANLNKSLLAFSRRQDLHPQRVEMNATVTGMAAMLRHVIGERIVIDVAIHDTAWPVRVDLSQLESTILNLAINSRDAMPDGGRLFLETSNAVLDAAYAIENRDVVPGEYAVIAISDTGSGMTAETLARVFEPFFTTKEVGKGTGLGLSMVHGFIKQSSGHIKIYSEPGRGTTVRLYLPRDRGGTDADTAEKGVENKSAGGGETVLLVEDNEALRRVAAAKVLKLGYRVIEASNSTDALRVIEDGIHPDLLFTDVVMAGALDGIELATEASRRLPSLKILLTSGFTERRASSGSDRELSWPLLSKPYRSTELAQALRRALDR